MKFRVEYTDVGEEEALVMNLRDKSDHIREVESGGAEAIITVA